MVGSERCERCGYFPFLCLLFALVGEVRGEGRAGGEMIGEEKRMEDVS